MNDNNNIKDNNNNTISIRKSTRSRYLDIADMHVALLRHNSAVGVIQPLGPLFQENKSLLDPEEGLVFCRSVKKTRSKVKPRDVVLRFKKKWSLSTRIYERKKKRIKRCKLTFPVE